MTAHSPAPWTANMDEKGIMRVSALCYDANITAEVFGVREYDGEDAANALLIAAAPELLDACKCALEYIEPDEAPRLHKVLRLAVDKAEGR